MIYKKPDREPSEIDWARLAAFIDGEGCIYISTPNRKSGKGTCLYVGVTNTDPRLVSWLGNTFGGVVYGNPHKKNTNVKWSLAYKWVIASRQAVPILERCMPYFVIKKEQAEIGLAHQSLVRCKREKDHTVSKENVEKRLELRDRLSLLKGTHARRKDLRTVRSNQQQEIREVG